ncbi:MAG: threonylcarbamoyl-AMP synthase [Candidatus Brockarchaeota archaeon]|nr:threonylcarbamoyl-AMP synthase [Candidatus Brockarchaeota archaeon]
MAKVFDCSTANARYLGAKIKSGAVIIFPTDTVYGLGCDPFNENAIVRILEAKRRGPAPMPLLSPSLEAVGGAANLTAEAKKLADRFWPGALTMVLEPKMRFNAHLSNRRGQVGFRVPGNEFARKLASESGGILVGTSANVSGRPAATTLREALRQLGSKVDFAVNGGKLPGVPSTVVSFSRGRVKVLREGAIPAGSILEPFGKRWGRGGADQL